jgi:hypothetical protein
MIQIEIRISLFNTKPEILQKCKVGRSIGVWSVPDFECVMLYAPRSIGKEGLMARIPKEGMTDPALQVLGRCWQGARGEIVAIDGTTVTVLITTTAPDDADLPQPPAAPPAV